MVQSNCPKGFAMHMTLHTNGSHLPYCFSPLLQYHEVGCCWGSMQSLRPCRHMRQQCMPPIRSLTHILQLMKQHAAPCSCVHNSSTTGVSRVGMQRQCAPLECLPPPPAAAAANSPVEATPAPHMVGVLLCGRMSSRKYTASTVTGRIGNAIRRLQLESMSCCAVCMDGQFTYHVPKPAATLQNYQRLHAPAIL
jgi:hypothetical protein